MKETKASKLRAARNYSTRSSTPSQDDRSNSSTARSTVNKQKTTKKKKQQQVWICRICSSEIGNSASIGCDGKCNDQWFHPSCVNFSDEEFSTFQNTEGSSWKCSDCTPSDSSSTAAQSGDIPGPLTQYLADCRTRAE